MEQPRQLRGVLASSAHTCLPVSRAEPGSSESRSGARRPSLKPHLPPACSGPKDRMAWPPGLWSKGQVLGKQAELTLGGIKRKGNFFGRTSEPCQISGRLPA